MWSYPLLNLLLKVVKSLGESSWPAVSGNGPAVTNVEEIEWEDRKGRIRTTRIRREIK